VQSLARSLSLLGKNVTVVCLSSGLEDSLDRDDGIDVVRVAIRSFGKSPIVAARSPLEKVAWAAGLLLDPQQSSRLASRIVGLRPDIVHTNHIAALSSGFVPLVRAAGLPVVHTVRDYFLRCATSIMQRSGRSCGRTCVGCAPVACRRRCDLSRIQSLVFTSDALRRAHGSLMPALRPEAVDTIPNSYDADAERSMPEWTGHRFGYIGRITHEKGVVALLDAFDMLDDPDCELHIAGDDEFNLLPGQISRLRSRHRIICHGFVPREAFYERVDAVVVPSLWEEPFGRIVIEANAHGKPCIVSNRGGLPELVLDGTTGRVGGVRREAQHPGALW
jgi:glycosyltransferase involved in cell wall biosynthesis